MRALLVALGLLGSCEPSSCAYRWGYPETPDAGVDAMSTPAFADCRVCCAGEAEPAACVQFCEESKRYIAATCRELLETLAAQRLEGEEPLFGE